jgi:outer membrane lipoprotein carrier protein
MLIINAGLAIANTASEKLAAIFKPVTTITGQFTQTVYDQNGQAIAKSNGDFSIQRPNHFRWSVNNPMQQLTIADGKKLWLYQPDLLQVTVSPMTQKIGHTPLAILSGSTTALNSTYSITQQSAKQFTLVAKQQNNTFTKIVLLFAGARIEQMQLFDSLNQKTIIDFSNVKLNASINNNAFKFAIPKGVDVIKG